MPRPSTSPGKQVWFCTDDKFLGVLMRTVSDLPRRTA
jgi:hypothetical protein